MGTNRVNRENDFSHSPSTDQSFTEGSGGVLVGDRRFPGVMFPSQVFIPANIMEALVVVIRGRKQKKVCQIPINLMELLRR